MHTLYWGTCSLVQFATCLPALLGCLYSPQGANVQDDCQIFARVQRANVHGVLNKYLLSSYHLTRHQGLDWVLICILSFSLHLTLCDMDVFINPIL